jgi:hypothetical protein
VIQYSRFRMTDDGNKTTVCGNREQRSLFSRAVVFLPPPPPSFANSKLFDYGWRAIEGYNCCLRRMVPSVAGEAA